MPSKLYVNLIVALGVLCGVAAIVQAANTLAARLPSATLTSPQEQVTTYHVRDMDGRIVTVDVPSMASPGLKMSDPAQGIVRAIVQSIDGERNQVKVQTQEGQTLVLSLPPESITALQVGDEFMLQVAQRSVQ